MKLCELMGAGAGVPVMQKEKETHANQTRARFYTRHVGNRDAEST